MAGALRPIAPPAIRQPRRRYKAGYTLDMYRQIFRVSVYLQVHLATFKRIGTVTIVCLTLGYPWSYLLATRRRDRPNCS